MEKAHNYVYKITNTINNMYYIGKHSTDNLNDGYMGSGYMLECAINYYGIDAFKKEILFDFKTEAEAYAKEAELMPEISCNSHDPMCYNLKPGGVYHTMTDEIKNKIAKTVSVSISGEKNGMYGKKLKDCMTPEKYEAWCKNNGDCYWANNGTIQRKIKNGQPLPEGFVKGRLESTNEKVGKANKGREMKPESIQKMIETKRKNGTFKRTRESVEKQMKTRRERGISSATTTGFKWFTNGISQKLVDPANAPEGWHEGRATQGFKWYTDGVESRQFASGSEIPEGWTPGRTIATRKKDTTA